MELELRALRLQVTVAHDRTALYTRVLVAPTFGIPARVDWWVPTAVVRMRRADVMSELVRRYIDVPDVSTGWEVHTSIDATHVVAISATEHANPGKATTALAREQTGDRALHVLHVGAPVLTDATKLCADITRIWIGGREHPQIWNTYDDVCIALIHDGTCARNCNRR